MTTRVKLSTTLEYKLKLWTIYRFKQHTQTQPHLNSREFQIHKWFSEFEMNISRFRVRGNYVQPHKETIIIRMSNRSTEVTPYDGSKFFILVTYKMKTILLCVLIYKSLFIVYLST